MLGDVTDNADHTLTLDDLAFVANLFNRCSYFHNAPLHVLAKCASEFQAPDR